MSRGELAETGERCGFAAIIGATNAGKSTLVNALVGAKVSIVTHKAQTTRGRVRGIALSGKSQIILVDTPGIFAPRRRLDRAMVETAWGEAREADMAVVLSDAAKGLDDILAPVEQHKQDLRMPLVLALNKVDKVPKPRLLSLADEAARRLTFDRIFMISALKGDGVEDLKAYLAEKMPLGPWLFAEDQIADMPLRQWAAEITREKLFLRLHEEVPYSLTVETVSWKELKDGSIRIEQTIYVERESQRKIVLGEKGRVIKQISMEARSEISQGLEVPVHLFLFVKVRENWAEDPERYREMGLEYPKL
ncbi:MAG TPA: GTPase Era [Hyphomicrobiales bacterium]|nr:GTPase Era [Hyphomicrobiales bacterium]